ncbi:conserved hypothetical protein [Neospora caninum Liverpool]|uniref:Uncharacterized protein n=1 Tax=Neospora caninum (strain Liverpool) TaxID=572307 RepID=F0VNU6_NEOCL|nr:conserved hypothetical protein [Neospora caninum Liverpool]CBZ55392.1 conserved hypothetical protein [Neospora caninum Liverpool]|eukprot:XP_003885420.1 conserved hypothetical protein [Neospora caninum Liverpool]
MKPCTSVGSHVSQPRHVQFTCRLRSRPSHPSFALFLSSDLASPSESLSSLSSPWPSSRNLSPCSSSRPSSSSSVPPWVPPFASLSSFTARFRTSCRPSENSNGIIAGPPASLSVSSSLVPALPSSLPSSLRSSLPSSLPSLWSPSFRSFPLCSTFTVSPCASPRQPKISLSAAPPLLSSSPLRFAPRSAASLSSLSGSAFSTTAPGLSSNSSEAKSEEDPAVALPPATPSSAREAAEDPPTASRPGRETSELEAPDETPELPLGEAAEGKTEDILAVAWQSVTQGNRLSEAQRRLCAAEVARRTEEITRCFASVLEAPGDETVQGVVGCGEDGEEREEGEGARAPVRETEKKEVHRAMQDLASFFFLCSALKLTSLELRESLFVAASHAASVARLSSPSPSSTDIAGSSRGRQKDTAAKPQEEARPAVAPSSPSSSPPSLSSSSPSSPLSSSPSSGPRFSPPKWAAQAEDVALLLRCIGSEGRGGTHTVHLLGGPVEQSEAPGHRPEMNEKEIIEALVEALLGWTRASMMTAAALTNALQGYAWNAARRGCSPVDPRKAGVFLRPLERGGSHFFSPQQLAEILEALLLLNCRTFPRIRDVVEAITAELLRTNRSSATVSPLKRNSSTSAGALERGNVSLLASCSLAPQQLALWLVVLAKYRVENDEAFEVMAEILQQPDVVRKHLSPSLTAGLAYAFGKFLGGRQQVCLETLGIGARQKLHLFSLGDLSQLLVSLTRAGIADRVLFARSAVLVRRSLTLQPPSSSPSSPDPAGSTASSPFLFGCSDASPEQVVNLCVTFARQKQGDDRLFEGLAALLLAPPPPWLISTLVKETPHVTLPETRLECLTAEDLISVVVAFAQIRKIQKPLFEAHAKVGYRSIDLHHCLLLSLAMRISALPTRLSVAELLQLVEAADSLGLMLPPRLGEFVNKELPPEYTPTFFHGYEERY